MSPCVIKGVSGGAGGGAGAGGGRDGGAAAVGGAPPNSVSWTEEADVVAEAEAGVCGGAIAGSAAGYS